MMWELYSANTEDVVISVYLPKGVDTPDVVIHQGVLYYYDSTCGKYVVAVVHDCKDGPT